MADVLLYLTLWCVVGTFVFHCLAYQVNMLNSGNYILPEDMFKRILLITICGPIIWICYCIAIIVMAACKMFDGLISVLEKYLYGVDDV